MTRQNINTGSAANDGTGDTLRSAGTKINSNFIELYNFLGAEGDSSTLASRIKFQDSAVVFEGSNFDAHETRLFAEEPTADRVVTIPNATGTIVFKDTTDTLTNKTLTSPNIATIVNGGTLTLPSGADTLVARTSTDTLTNKTLTTPTITAPIIGTAINDVNGNELIKFTATGSAVNEITLANGASTNGPTISATGTGSNLNITLTPKGTGSVNIGKAAYGTATMTASNPAPPGATLIICNVNTGTLNVALADGTTDGEYKIFTNKGSVTATVTPTNFANGTSFSLPQNKATQCIWDGTNWFMLNGADSSATNITIT